MYRARVDNREPSTKCILNSILVEEDNNIDEEVEEEEYDAGEENEKSSEKPQSKRQLVTG